MVLAVLVRGTTPHLLLIFKDWSNCFSFMQHAIQLCLISHYHHISAVPTVHPARDQYVPYNSIKNVTFSCAVESGSPAIWEVMGTQVLLQRQREAFAHSGVFISGDLESNYSTISVSFEARRMFRELSVLCVSNQVTSGNKGMTYSVVSFGKWMHSDTCTLLCFWRSNYELYNGKL